MGIILGLLKIAGIILLIILAVILVLICLFLFIPFRYRLRAQYPAEGEPGGYAAVSWLFRLVSVRAVYDKKRMNVQFKVCGIPVFDLIRRKQSAERRKAKDGAGKKKRREESAAGKAGPEERPAQIEDNASAREGMTADTGQPPALEEPPASAQDKKTEQVPDDKAASVRPAQRTGPGSGDAAAPAGAGGKEPEAAGNERTEDGGGGRTRRKGKRSAAGILTKIRNAWQNVRNFFLRIKKALLDIRTTLRKAAERVKKIVEQIEYYRDLFAEEGTKALLTKVWGKAGTIVRMMRPKYLRLHLIIGTGDPASTAQLLAIQGMLYPFVGGRIEIIPVFDAVHLEGDIDVRGSITTFTALLCVLQVVFDKRSKSFIKRLRL